MKLQGNHLEIAFFFLKSLPNFKELESDVRLSVSSNFLLLSDNYKVVEDIIITRECLNGFW